MKDYIHSKVLSVVKSLLFEKYYSGSMFQVDYKLKNTPEILLTPKQKEELEFVKKCIGIRESLRSEFGIIDKHYGLRKIGGSKNLYDQYEYYITINLDYVFQDNSDFKNEFFEMFRIECIETEEGKEYRLYFNDAFRLFNEMLKTELLKVGYDVDFTTLTLPNEKENSYGIIDSIIDPMDCRYTSSLSIHQDYDEENDKELDYCVLDLDDSFFKIVEIVNDKKTYYLKRKDNKPLKLYFQCKYTTLDVCPTGSVLEMNALKFFKRECQRIEKYFKKYLPECKLVTLNEMQGYDPIDDGISLEEEIESLLKTSQERRDTFWVNEREKKDNQNTIDNDETKINDVNTNGTSLLQRIKKFFRIFEKDNKNPSDISSMTDEEVRNNYTILNNNIDKHLKRLKMISLIFLIGAIVLSILFSIIIPDGSALEFSIPILVVSIISLVVVLIPKNKMINIIMMSALLFVDYACLTASYVCGIDYYNSYRIREENSEYSSEEDYSSESSLYNDYRIYVNEDIKYFYNGDCWIVIEVAYDIKTATILDSIEGIQVTEIGENAFQDCYSLTQVHIPNTIITIGEYAFEGCSSLERVVIPDSVTTIEKYAFYECRSLRSVIIPIDVTSMGEYAFGLNYSLTIYCEAESKPDGWDDDWNKIDGDEENTVYWYLSKYGLSVVDDIMYATFNDGKAMIIDYLGAEDELEIPSTITIDDTTYNVTMIDDGAFSGSTRLNKVYIPSTITTIGKYIFDGCKIVVCCEAESKPDGWDEEWNNMYYSEVRSPEDIIVYWNVSKHEICVIDDIIYNIVGDYAIIKKYIGNELFINIPSTITIDGTTYDVTTIEDRAFEDCSLEKVFIPKSIINIGDGPFYDCNYWLTIYCEAESKPDGWSGYWNNSDYQVVWNVAKHGLITTNDMVFVVINGEAILVKYLADEDQIEMPSVITDDGLTYELTTIDGSVFYGKRLSSITIPNSVTSIGDGAFENCNSLASIVFEEDSKLTSIGGDAFYNCDSLTSITIPNSVTSIGYDAFDNCDFLRIYCEVESKPDGWSDNWNGDCLTYWFGQWEYDSSNNPTPLN